VESEDALLEISELAELETELELLIKTVLLIEELELETELSSLLELDDNKEDELELSGSDDEELDFSLLEIWLLELLSVALLKLLETLDDDGSIITIIELELSLELLSTKSLLSLLLVVATKLLELEAAIRLFASEDRGLEDALDELLAIGFSPLGTLDEMELAAGSSLPPPPPPQAPRDKARSNAAQARKGKPME